MPSNFARLADREDDVLDQLREQQDVGDLGLQRLLEHDRRPAGSDDQNRGARLLTNGCELIRRQTRAPGRVEDGVQVAARQGRSSVGDCDACADQLELRMTREGLAQLLEALAGTRAVDAHALSLIGVRNVVTHGYGPLWPGPSLSMDRSSCQVFGLSEDFAGGRSCRYQSATGLS